MRHPLDALLRPRSVAVVGASRKRGTIAAEVLHNLLHSGFTGAVYPVNPSAAVVQSVRAYRTILEVPDEVDLAVIVVPARSVLEAVEDCGRKGVLGLVVITAGFGETGQEGKALQARLVERVRHHRMRMVGPNCLGLLNADPAIRLDATFAPTFPPFGGVAFSSQSGALGLAILDHARNLGVGISQFVSVGNKADVSGNDLIEYWEDDPATKVILLYLENLGNPRRFMRIARRVGRRKPIAVVKSGRTAAGARAASSHTGALAGADIAVDALLMQAGVLRTDTIDELFDLAMVLANQPVPKGGRVAVLTNAGGPGIMASDALESRGLEVARLSAESEAALRSFLPAEASVHNPVDMIASATEESYERALRILLEDEGVDSVIVIFVTPIVTDPSAVANAITRGANGTAKTVVTCMMGTHGAPEAIEALRGGRFPSYAFPESAARALATATRYGRWLAEPEGELPVFFGLEPMRAKAALERAAPGGWLDAAAVRELLAAYGIRMPAVTVARTRAEVVAAATRPSAVKLMSDTIQHKTEVGGVELDVAGEAAGDAYDRIVSRLEALGRRDEMSGVVVQEMVPMRTEIFIGATLDPAYGHLVGVGLGGVNVELLRDIVFRVAPLRDVDAQHMVNQIRGRAVFDGFRGAPPVDRAAVIEVLLRVSRMVDDLPEIAELDLNPLRVTDDGVVVLDARIRRVGG